MALDSSVKFDAIVVFVVFFLVSFNGISACNTSLRKDLRADAKSMLEIRRHITKIRIALVIVFEFLILSNTFN